MIYGMILQLPSVKHLVSFNGGERVNEPGVGDGVGWLEALQPTKGEGV